MCMCMYMLHGHVKAVSMHDGTWLLACAALLRLCVVGALVGVLSCGGPPTRGARGTGATGCGVWAPRPAAPRTHRFVPAHPGAAPPGARAVGPGLGAPRGEAVRRAVQGPEGPRGSTRSRCDVAVESALHKKQPGVRTPRR